MKHGQEDQERRKVLERIRKGRSQARQASQKRQRSHEKGQVLDVQEIYALSIRQVVSRFKNMQGKHDEQTNKS